ncbi:Aste57867_198 [Aphanomyces stellatus]|uniref:Aste57867_198 protein n=1 Tax=Aphanomyces stellatus TaxID=120398 RepID=A0A485K761_9STRA|nr:hypothetical protein As57867_000198 [Aphanomyces stellatus]VFT77424.1 Aste57867_198 [Aphanomyces stellatus]
MHRSAAAAASTLRKTVTSSRHNRTLHHRRNFSRRAGDVSRLWTVGSFPLDDEVKTPMYDTWGMLSGLPISHGFGYTSALNIIDTLPPSTAPSSASTTAAPSSTASSANSLAKPIV